MLITVITPVYNRAYIIEKLYQSLLRQTSQSFEWIIVDDGSTDGLKDLVKGWESNIDIVYLHQENGGKHRALNYGLQYAKGEYTFIIDSDDYLVEDAIETINEWVVESYSETIAGISGTRGNYKNGKLELIGNFPNTDKVIATNLERRKKRLSGDKAEIYKTDILKQFPFPEFDNEKFIPENVVWDQIALNGFQIIWNRKILVICDYLPDGLTRANKKEQFRNNFEGFITSFQLSWKGLPFPYNYSSLVECHRLMKKCGMQKQISKYFNLNAFQSFLLKVICWIK